MQGDATLFMRADQVEDVVGRHHAGPGGLGEQRRRSDFPNYAAGTWGPKTPKC